MRIDNRILQINSKLFYIKAKITNEIISSHSLYLLRSHLKHIKI